MDLQDLRQKLYLAALQQYRTAQEIEAAGHLRRQVEIVSVEELAWIECLSVKDLEFLKVQKIAP